MARFSLVVLVVLAACGNTAAPASSPNDPDATAVLSSPPGWEQAADSGASAALVDAGPIAVVDAGPAPVVDAGPALGFLGGWVILPGELPAVGATVSLAPAGLTTTTDLSGDYNFDAVPPGPFTVTATLVGYPSGTASGTMAPGGTLTENAILLERSTALFAPDAGFRPTWMAFAPDGGPLYAADEGSMWRVPEDGGATPLISGDPTLEPLGFGSDGTPIYLAGVQAAVDGGLGSAVAELGLGIGIPIGFYAPGPYLIGDEVYFAGAPFSGNSPTDVQAWSVVSAKSPAPAVAVPQAFASPAPQPTTFALAGYRPVPDFLAPCVQAFPTGGISASAICPSDWPMPSALGVSPDGDLAALEFSTSANLELASDSWQVTVASAAGNTPLSQHSSATQYADLVSIVPLGPSSAAEIFDDGSIVFDQPWGTATVQGTNVAGLPNGSALFLDGAALYLEGSTFGATSNSVSFGGSWSQPVVSPDGFHVVFPGVPMVVSADSGASVLASQPLDETPRAAQFSQDGATLLILAEDGSLHLINFGAVLVDTTLEGTATLAQLAPGGGTVVYAGTAPDGRGGIFEQPAAPPPVPPSTGADAGA